MSCPLVYVDTLQRVLQRLIFSVTFTGNYITLNLLYEHCKKLDELGMWG